MIRYMQSIDSINFSNNFLQLVFRFHKPPHLFTELSQTLGAATNTYLKNQQNGFFF
jgi:hypothetical protein